MSRKKISVLAKVINTSNQTPGPSSTRRATYPRCGCPNLEEHRNRQKSDRVSRDRRRYDQARARGFDSNIANRRSPDPIRREAYLARHREGMRAYREVWGRPDCNFSDRVNQDLIINGINGKPTDLRVGVGGQQGYRPDEQWIRRSKCPRTGKLPILEHQPLPFIIRGKSLNG